MQHFLICNSIVCCLLCKVDTMMSEIRYSSMCLYEYFDQILPEPVECDQHCCTLFVQQNCLNTGRSKSLCVPDDYSKNTQKYF
jgi:hypothetical protein